MADAASDANDLKEVKADGSNDSTVAADVILAENGTSPKTTDEVVLEPPKKRGRPASGKTPRRTPKRKSKEEKPPTQPTRRSTRRSVSSRSSEETTSIEKLDEPLETVANEAETENIDTDKKLTDGFANETEDKNDIEQLSEEIPAESANDKNNESNVTQQVEAEA